MKSELSRIYYMALLKVTGRLIKRKEHVVELDILKTGVCASFDSFDDTRCKPSTHR